MCGITGISLRAGRPVKAEQLARLAEALAHRGPDGEGTYLWQNYGLAHRRLSIIDVAGGAQPISSADKRAHIICNGEIYNYKAVQTALKKAGVELQTSSDSEIPLHLYRQHGLDFVRYLDGMYALAILDETSGELILARDPVGIKPLYFSVKDAGVAFASEPGALVRGGWQASEVNDEVWAGFFNRQYVRGSATLFKGIERVEPGEVMIIKNGAITRRVRFPEPILTAASRISEAEALDAFDELLSRTVSTHLQSEVPYGAFLSGGIDSGAVVTKMAALAGEVTTYTIGFESKAVADERTQAYRLANKLHTQHIPVSFTEADFWAMLPEMCDAMDDLVADYAALPTLKLARRASQDVKVILSGEGGDEAFAGYGRYRRGGLLDTLRGRKFRGRGDTAGFGTLFRQAEITHWRESGPLGGLDMTDFTRLQERQAFDIGDWLPDDLLTKVDRCLMAYGIEGRVPLLDRHLLAYAFALPDQLKVQGKNGKYLLKKWLANQHPELDVWAPKRGFTVPVQAWLENRRERLLPYLHSHAGVQQVMVRKELRHWLERPLDSRGAKLLFSVLCYAVWHDIYIQGQLPPAELFETPPKWAENAA